jgi:hypothetical protein
MTFYTGGSERMRLDTSGNLGIGTTPPSAKLTVVGPVKSASTTQSSLYLSNGAQTNGFLVGRSLGSGDTQDFFIYDTVAAATRLAIDSSGNVGIGNSSPGGFRLNVTGSIYQTDGYATFGQYNAGTSGTSPVAGGISFSTNITSGNAEADVWNGNDPASYANTGILFTQRLTSTTRRDLVFMHNNGNVGIGTNSPAGRLDVRTAAGVVAQSNLYTGSNASVVKFNIGQIGAVDWDIGLSASSGNFYIGGLGGTMAEAYRITRTGAAIDFQTWNTGGSERMRIDSSGNVNIGSASTTAAAGGRVFDIYNLENTNSSSYALARLITYNVAGTTSVSADIFKNKAGSFVFNNNETNSAANTSFGVGGSERMRIDSSGNLLVGTTSTNPISSRVNGVAILPNGFITRGTSTTHAFGLNATSGTNIAFYTDNGSAAVLAGNVASNGSTTTYNVTSDYRLKTVVGAINDSGTRIDALYPVEYTWNSNGQRTRGFLAHQFQEVYADSVTGTKDAVDNNGNPEYQSMQAGTAEVIADLVAEIQSLRKRLTALEST